MVAKRRLVAPVSTVSLPVPANTVEGTALRVGPLNVVTLTDEAKGGNAALHATCAIGGSFVLSVAGGTLAEGAAVYIDPSNVVTATATSNTLFGIALGPKATGANDVEVLIVGN